MPEGHTIHHLARKLHRAFADTRVRASSPQGRFDDGAAQLDGTRLIRAEALGKHALLHFEDASLHVHLGLYGRTRWHKAPAPEPKGAVRLRLQTDRRCFDLIGPTRCELADPDDVAKLAARLGADPLRDDADPARVRAAFAKTRRPVGAVLLDQSVIAGLGNVYRAELLFLAGIDPHTPAKQLTTDQVDGLWANAVRALEIGVKHNAIRLFGEQGLVGPAGAEALALDPADFEVRGRYGPKTDRLWVYKRPACKVCGGEITVEELGARTLYWCPTCQR